MKTQAPKWEEMSVKDKIQGVLALIFILFVGGFFLILMIGFFVGPSQTTPSPSATTRSETAQPPRAPMDMKQARALAETTLQTVESAYPSLFDAVLRQDARGKYDYVDKPLQDVAERWPTEMGQMGATRNFYPCRWAAAMLLDMSAGAIGQQTPEAMKKVGETEAAYNYSLTRCKQQLKKSDSELVSGP